MGLPIHAQSLHSCRKRHLADTPTVPTRTEHSGSSPKPPPTSRRRHFTAARANLALVLVKRIIADVVTEYKHMLELQESLEAARGNHAYEQAAWTRQELVRAAGKLCDCLRELEEVGVELKDWSLGVVDFPCIAGSREVYLCWQFGQERIEFWHEVDEDPAVRRHIEDLPLVDMSAGELYGWRTG